MRKLIPVFLLASAAWGAQVTAESLVGTSDTATKVKITLDTSVAIYLRYATSTVSDCTTAVGGSVLKSPKDIASTTPQFVLTGLVPGTQYYFLPCLVSDDSVVTASGGPSQPYTVTTTGTSARKAAYPTAPTSTGITGITPAVTGNTYTVGSDCLHASTGLQAHINTAAAVAGSAIHEIVIPVTTTNCAGYILKNRVGTGKIIIRTGNYSRLPPDNVQASLSDIQNMFKVRPALNATAMTCEAGAGTTADYIIIGEDWMPATGANQQFAHIFTNCTRVYIDRSSLITLTQSSYSYRNVDAEGTNNGIINSYMRCSGISSHEGICVGGDKPHGFLVKNNYILGAGIPVFWTDGGGDADWPQDISVVGNTFIGEDSQRFGSPTNTPTSTSYYPHRQPVEIKRCQRCEFIGNFFSNWWNDEILPSVVFLVTPRPNGSGGSCLDGQIVADINFSYNMIAGKSPGLHDIWAGNQGGDGPCAPFPLQRFLISHNILVQIDNAFSPIGCTAPTCPAYSGPGFRGVIFRAGGVEDYIAENNTIYGHNLTITAGGRTINFTDNPMGDPIFRNNLAFYISDGGGQSGCIASPQTGGWWPDGSVPTLCKDKITEHWGTRYIWAGNVIFPYSPSVAGDITTQMPATGTVVPTNLAAVGFAAEASTSSSNVRDFRVNEFTSAYRNSGSDGRAPGADWIGVMTRVGGVQGFAVTGITASTISVTFKSYGGRGGPGGACYVDAYTASDFSGVPVRQIATVTVGSQNTATVTGLSGTTGHYLRAHCGGAPFFYGGESAPTPVTTR